MVKKPEENKVYPCSNEYLRLNVVHSGPNVSSFLLILLLIPQILCIDDQFIYLMENSRSLKNHDKNYLV